MVLALMVMWHQHVERTKRSHGQRLAEAKMVVIELPFFPLHKQTHQGLRKWSEQKETGTIYNIGKQTMLVTDWNQWMADLEDIDDIEQTSTERTKLGRGEMIQTYSMPIDAVFYSHM